MSGRETLAVTATTFMFSLVSYYVLVMWIAGGEPLGLFARVFATVIGLFLVPVATAASTALIVNYWDKAA